MDYTLATYKSPQYEDLAFQILRDRLVDTGYPQELKQFKYEPSFPVRTNFLIVTFQCMYSNKLREKANEMYPNMFLKFDKDRIHVMSTLFDLPELYLLACIIHFMHDNDDYVKESRGVMYQSLYISYKSILQDVEEAMKWMHEVSGKMVLLMHFNSQNLYKYYVPLRRFWDAAVDLSIAQAKRILLLQGNVRHWTTYFDYIVVDAKKPVFFQEGTLMRAVDVVSKEGNLIRAKGKDVLYIGDHIFGDILKSKRQVGWKTFLVVPELLNEIYVWKKKNALFDRLTELDNEVKIASEMNESYGLLGSLFRHGSRLTTFSSQTMQFADIYSHSCFNLIYYPLCYMFRAHPMLMPHESTVPHAETALESFKDLEDVPCGLRRRTKTGRPR
ncbi:unnamed protein product [Mesocestoides corti]|uniref:Uncharacterized protein n=1 Tax=Mesocestoides corti TaxID=53468 RepID=A0A158QTV5_MESCO|nr:unnamed protein product [Mesocestoides corti]